MTLRFHWYLPTNGDSRDIVGGELGLAAGAARRDPPGDRSPTWARSPAAPSSSVSRPR